MYNTTLFKNVKIDFPIIYENTQAIRTNKSIDQCKIESI